MSSASDPNGPVASLGLNSEQLPYGRHLQQVLDHHRRLERFTKSDNEITPMTVCGSDLGLAQIVAASRSVRLDSSPPSYG